MSKVKLFKAKGQEATDVEKAVERAFLELETSSKELAAPLKDIYITSVREVSIDGGRSALVVFVPFRVRKQLLAVQARLTRELEKRFNGKHVVLLSQRTILAKDFSRKFPGQKRPVSRTLTAVHEAILDDLVYPTAIVAKRTRVRTDSSRLLKVYLDPKDTKEVDTKLATFAAVYKRLTNKPVEFLFPVQDL